MTTYSTAKVGPEDIEFYFADSGPVAGSSDYTTLVMFHGSAFNSHSFHKLLPLAAPLNLRLVIVNRREYRGSSRYTNEEITHLQAGRKLFLERIGLHVAEFLHYYAETYDIPKISDDRRRGGFALLGWSIGVATVLALLGHPDAIPKEYYGRLEPYLRTVVLYDPPYLAFGYEITGVVNPYNPWTDPSIPTPEERYQKFHHWVSSYYDHPDTSSGSMLGLDYRPRTAQASIDNMPKEELAVMYEEAAAVRSELHMVIDPMQPTINVQAKAALFDEELAKMVLPNMRVVHVVGVRSHWHCMWGYIEAKKEYDSRVAKGEKVRPINFVEIPEGNHFMHWDRPAEFLDAIARAVTAC
ncbi:hypothetical protein NEOLEDRAFT_689420 [Neolentinus lepideus HHB14362 ss-1]|uniref:AB hydrolase-1 domain-containing protein n=1 Tax=Neolentinus lepideus HHB14362 ss-1 TaxID=1314782 RepID=A0A165V119_9AGAM|nr:hypothetical protein NEOLEDRAFT_689420 [Neolentinus lepideus HHB14362 ss-1]